MEAEVAGREVELLVVGRVVGDVHLAVHAADGAVGLEDDCRVVVETCRATLEEAGDEHDAVLPGNLRVELCCLARDGEGVAEVVGALRLAEVGTVVQFLQHDELCALLCKFGDAGGQLLPVLCYAVGAALLYDAYLHFFIFLFFHFLGKLHRAAVQAAVLDDERAAVDADDVVPGERFAELLFCLQVGVCVAVCGR